MESRVSTKVALKAREVLIQCALPSLEERAAQIEHILRSSIVESRYGETGWEHRTPHQETLKEVIDSKYTVFDVLPTFFAHADPWVSLAALEVYVRRAYRAYKLHAVNYHNLDSEPPFIVTWGFQLMKVGVTEYGMTQPSAPATPTVERGDGFKRVGSISDLSFLVGKSEIEPVRKGVIIPVTFLDEAEEYLVRALELIPLGKGAKSTGGGLMANLEERRRSMPLSALEAEEEEDSLPTVCNVTVRDAESMDDKDLLERILPLVADHKDVIFPATFVVSLSSVATGTDLILGTSPSAVLNTAKSRAFVISNLRWLSSLNWVDYQTSPSSRSSPRTVISTSTRRTVRRFREIRGTLLVPSFVRVACEMRFLLLIT